MAGGTEVNHPERIDAMTPEAFGAAVIDSIPDENLFAAAFQPQESWRAWFIALRLFFRLPLSAEDWRIASACTGRVQPFATAPTEAWFLCGRRSGKSRILALLAVCAACFRDYSEYLAPGERALVMVLAKDRDQAQVIFGYARALISETPILAAMIERETAETLELTNGVVIAVHTSSYKSVRGRTLVAALADETAFWESDDSRNPAEAVIRALRPSLATIPGAFLLCASSTYTAEGVLFEAYSKHYGKDTSPVLVWKADTATMNPSFRKEVIEAAYAADAKDAAAEYGSEWLVDVRQHFPEADINAAIVPDRQSIARDPLFDYQAFGDPSGGVSDSMTLAIAHIDASRMVVLDRLEAVKPPFRPEDVCQRFADILSAYGLTEVVGDRFAAEWTVAAFGVWALITEHRSSRSRKSTWLRNRSSRSGALSFWTSRNLPGSCGGLSAVRALVGGMPWTIRGALTMTQPTALAVRWCSLRNGSGARVMPGSNTSASCIAAPLTITPGIVG